MANLDRYRSKRHFQITPEPDGIDDAQPSGRGLRFVVQEHHARRLHYDFRLELDGVLRSWALPKAPSLSPAEKRLAVEVEDHPLAYADFAGTIPEGQYGAGQVCLWDQGIWRPTGDTDPTTDLVSGELKFELYGSVLQGGFVLVRLKPRPKERNSNWLLIKHRDSFPKEMAENAAANNPMPDFIAPQLCIPARVPPSGKDWQHEIKFDGYRVQLRVTEGRVRLRTRQGHDWTDRFSAIANAAQELPDCIVDGEAVILDAAGAPDFAALQEALAEGSAGDRCVFFAFDLLWAEGKDLRALPLAKRRHRLQNILMPGPHLRVSELFAGDGATVMSSACALKLEGVVSKQLSATYKSGRSAAWVKVKCRPADDFIVGGVVVDQTHTVKALLVGTGGGAFLRFEGRVGSGFDAKTRQDLATAIATLQSTENPFTPHPALRARTGEALQWLRPILVATVAFAARTSSGLLRQASLLRLKTPAAMARRGGGSARVLGVQITHPDKPLWPAVGAEEPVTKLALAEYFAREADNLLRAIGGRPVSLLRCPDGIEGQRFFQRHAMPGGSELINQVRVDERHRPYLQIDSPEALVAAAQSGAIELHPWNCAANQYDQPGRLVFDLDPDTEVSFSDVVFAAHEVKRRLADYGLAAFCKTTGGKGLHVVVPLAPNRKTIWRDAKAFSLRVCREMERDAPTRYVTTMAKAARRGRIFLDYLRNDRLATAVAAFSPRAREGAPVSMPIPWSEVTPSLDVRRFRLKTVVAVNDPWADYESAAAPLPRVE